MRMVKTATAFPRGEHEQIRSLLQKLDEATTDEAYEQAEQDLQALIKGRDSYAPSDTTGYIPYPDYDHPAFNDILGAKKEFRRHAYAAKPKGQSVEVAAKERCDSGRFALTPNQTFLRDFMSPLTPYRGVLLFHSVGVGKTCTAITIAERYLEEVGASRRVLVILPTTLKDNFRKQICDLDRVPYVNGAPVYEAMQQCTGSAYIKRVPDAHVLSKDALEKKVHRLIQQRYQFFGFLEFANYVEELRKEIEKTEMDDAAVNRRFLAKIRDLFSDRLILVDEAHNLRTETTKSKKFPLLQKVLRHGRNNRLVLMTATPMFNSATEVLFILNLLLLNDKRSPVSPSAIFHNDRTLKPGGAEVLQTLFRGYVSYMRGENPISFPARLYPSINNDSRVMKAGDFPSRDIRGNPIPKGAELSGLEIIRSDMSPLQAKVYELALRSENIQAMEDKVAQDAVDVEIFDDEASNNALQKMTQISNIVYPGGGDRDAERIQSMYGVAGFHKCFKRLDRRADSFQVSYQDDVEPFLQPDRLGSVSPKMKAIVDTILNSTGVVYVYSFYIYAGILPLAIALEHAGFRRLNAPNLLKDKSPASSKAAAAGVAKQGWTYSLLTRDRGLTKDFDKDVQAIRSAENKDGSVVKVILGTSVSSEGIDFKCIREVHLLEPWYHLNKVQQIVGRAIRHCSHMALPPSARNVTVYHHAAALPRSDQESMDLRIYRIAVNKQRVIDEVEHLMKTHAVDCLLNEPVLNYDAKKREFILPELVTSQKTRHASYALGDQRAIVRCHRTRPAGEPDASTFHLGFYEADLPWMTQMLVHWLNQSKSAVWTWEDIHRGMRTLVPGIEEEVLMLALDRMVQRETAFWFQQRESKLIYRGNSYIVRRAKQDRDNRDSLIHAPPLIQTLLLAEDSGVPSPSNPAPPGTEERPKTEKDDTALPAHIDAEHQRLSKWFTRTAFATKAVRAAVMDHVLDHLNEALYRDACRWVSQAQEARGKSAGAAWASALEESMDRAGVRLENRVFFVPHKGAFERVTERGWSAITPIEEKTQIEPQWSARLARLLSEPSDMSAFLTCQKGVPEFKLKPEKPGARGSVCQQGNTFGVEALRQRITELASPSSLNGVETSQLHKKHLCQLLEILLRMQRGGQPALLRPFDHWLLSRAGSRDTPPKPAGRRKKNEKI